jgi:hypothetical protein
MDHVLIGAAILLTSLLAMWVALPRDGKVRNFMRNDQVQAYYTVTILAGIVLGLLNIASGVQALL